MADEQLKPPVGTARIFSPLQQVASKTINQVNFWIGANKDSIAT